MNVCWISKFGNFVTVKKNDRNALLLPKNAHKCVSPRPAGGAYSATQPLAGLKGRERAAGGSMLGLGGTGPLKSCP